MRTRSSKDKETIDHSIKTFDHKHNETIPAKLRQNKNKAKQNTHKKTFKMKQKPWTTINN